MPDPAHVHVKWLNSEVVYGLHDRPCRSDVDLANETYRAVQIGCWNPPNIGHIRLQRSELLSHCIGNINGYEQAHNKGSRSRVFVCEMLRKSSREAQHVFPW